MLTNVYGLTNDASRSQFLEEVVLGRGNSILPWCVGGDFNIVRRMSERKGCSRVSSQMQQFSNWFDDLDLLDLPFGGASFS